MSRKANGRDTAARESFCGTRKTELVPHCEYPDRNAARRDLFAGREGDYNRRRTRSALGTTTPQPADRKLA